MARSLVVNSQTTIPAAELSITFARSSGPGGQNVNKVNSKVTLRWNVAETLALTPEVRTRFLQRFAPRISLSGDILISSDKYRDQPRNISDCYEKLRQLIQTALAPPRKRKKSQPTKASKERRLSDKREKSLRKQHRRLDIRDD